MIKPKTLSIDVETFSSVDIGKCGVYRYAESPDFEVLLFAYSVDYGDVQLVDFANGEELPYEVYEWLYDPEVEKTAFNANFERTCLTKYFGRKCYSSQWDCTMILAAQCGLPMSLAGVGAALELPEDKAKLKTGKDLIRYFCVPCRPTKTNGGRTRNMPSDSPEKWSMFCEYNIRDVETENTIRKMLLKWRPDYSEKKFWCLDQDINDKGIRVDTNLAKCAIQIGDTYRGELLTKCKQLTGLDNPNSTAQIKAWLEDQEDVEVLSLNKKTIADVYASLTTDETKEVLKLREEFSKSSNKKYEAFIRCACEDSHIRGMFQFYGASTGRFSGKLINVQNLPHVTIPDLDDARMLCLTGDAEDFECMYPKVQSALSALIRTTLIPEENSRFIVCDFSAIEARVLAWIANEEWRIKAFESGRDIYCESASKAFHIPVEKHGVNASYRGVGKTLELACIAEDQLVLTDHGLIPIQDVTTKMKVWDGEEWVEHEGVIYRGVKDVYEYDGLTATADHIVFTEMGLALPFEFAARSRSHLLRSGDCWKAVRMGANTKSGNSVQKWEASICTRGVSGLWENRLEDLRGFKKWEIERMQRLFYSTKARSKMVMAQILRCKTALHESEEPKVSTIRGPWNKILFWLSDRSCGVHGKRVRFSGERNGDRQGRYKRRLCAWKPPLGDACRKLSKPKADCSDEMGSEVLAVWTNIRKKASEKRFNTRRNNRAGKVFSRAEEAWVANYKGKARVYDIRNAGRHHRFTVSGVLVHNCGYGGGVGAMKNFGADRLGMSEEEMADAVAKWRDASPHVVALWKSLEEAAVRCIKRGRSTISTVGSIRFDLEDGVLWMTLPSGRRIAYWGVAMGQDRWGRPSMTYMTTNQQTRKWERTETYGAKLVENACQATARDVLKEALFNLDKAGYDVRATVHDEVIITVPNGFGSCQEVEELMCKGAEWTEGLPLNAESFECSSYRKG